MYTNESPPGGITDYVTAFNTIEYWMSDEGYKYLYNMYSNEKVCLYNWNIVDLYNYINELARNINRKY